MREYGQIQCSFWSDPDVQALSDVAKLLAAYLMTGPHSNGIGCYRLPDGYIQADLGWDSKTVSKGFAELFRIGFAKRCEATFFVLIPKFLKWNPISNGNVAKAREKEFEAITKKASIYAELCSSMLVYGNHWANGFETLLEGYAKQEPTQPIPEPEKNRDMSGVEPPDVMPLEKQKPKNGATDSAKRVLEFLNQKTGRAYQPTSANLDLIVARLKEGYDEDMCRSVIARKVRAWKDDDKMREYLRPATLFNAQKFNQYAGECVE